MRRTFRRYWSTALLCLAIVFAAALYASTHHHDADPAPQAPSANTPR